jgi:CDP-glycerol glycerophosphotransferase
MAASLGDSAEMPTVTVIVIVYNDAARLPRAVRSVLGQTFRDLEMIIVDDASVDATPRVADALAAAQPGRVRVIRLPENSGGCGRPRNVGIEHARGAYVMFLDSDDTLDRNACRNLVATAERTGADLVSGLCVRVREAGGEEDRWYPRLYSRHAVHRSVLERPGLLYDTLSTNKCYRREFLAAGDLRFTEDYHYEDLLFSVRAYLSARTIAIIPHRVYNWYVMLDADRRSISNRRDEIGNFRDRLAILRMIDDVLLAHGADDLKLAKDEKFLRHDLVLYVRDLCRRDERYRRSFVTAAGEYLAGIDPRAYERCPPVPAIAAFMIRERDEEGVIAAADYLANDGRIATDLVERDGRVYWCDRHLDTDEGRRVLDVTALGLHSPSGSILPLGARVTRFAADGGRVALAGEIVNPFRRIRPDHRVSARLEFRARRRGHATFRVPAVEVRADGDRIRWRTDFDLARRVRPLGFVDRVWDVRLRLTMNGKSIVIRPAADAQRHAGIAVPVRPRLTRLAGDRFVSYLTERGNLSFRLAAEGRAARRANRFVRRTAATRGVHRVYRRLLRSLLSTRKSARALATGRRSKAWVYRTVFLRLPVRRRMAVFESHLGRQYSDSPKYIYETLRRVGAPMQVTWSHSDGTDGFPGDARLVKRGSWAYYLSLARAEFWVDNQGFPAIAEKRPETTYIQTWHGSAFKTMGFDEPKTQAAGREQRARLQGMVDRFDYFVIRSRHDISTLVRAFRLRAEPLAVGYPRNDPLVTGGDPAEIDRLRRVFGVGDRRIVLYAPTFRSGGGMARRFRIPFDLERFARDLGRTHVLLVRPHYQNSVVLPPGVGESVRDASRIHDVTPLLLLADTLITDYSSVMFDYALLDRPMIFYVPDEEKYVHDTRGAYFDLADHAPGPVVRDEEHLFGVLADLAGVRERYAAARQLFVERFGEYDQGGAAKAIVERFFLGVRDRE